MREVLIRGKAAMQRCLNIAIPPKVAALALVIIILNLLDAYFTLYHLEHGAEEENPLMAWAINRSPLFFFILKFSISFVGVMGIIIISGGNGPSNPKTMFRALWIIIIFYSILTGWHLFLLSVTFRSF